MDILYCCLSLVLFAAIALLITGIRLLEESSHGSN